MPYIRTVTLEEADGELKRQYEAALRRAGRIFHIVSIQSLHPPALAASIRLYRTLMLDPGPLDRATREMIATVTSRELECFY